MGRTRDVSKILTSNTSILTLASASATYATKASTGSTLIIPSTISNTGGSASIGTNGTVSFTSASAISLNDVFSATYQNYKIIFTGTGADEQFKFRLRVDGADASGSEYWFGFPWVAFNAAAMQTPTVGENATSLAFGEIAGSNTLVTIDINSPYLVKTTTMNIHNSFSRGTSTGQARTFIGGCFHDLATSYTGFTIFPNAGSITGKVSVYGYSE